MKVMKPGIDKMQYLGGLSALDLDPFKKQIISIVGAGGKTSTLTDIILDYQRRGIPAIVTTTTHMYYPDEEWTFTESENEQQIMDMVSKHDIVWVGTCETKQKIAGVSIQGQNMLSRLPYSIVAEADGARRLPFKIPGPEEPVIFPQTNLVIGVLGMDALDKPICETTFRSERLAKYLSKDEQDPISEQDYCKIITSNIGLHKGVTNDMEYKIVLNKADDERLVERALRIRECLPTYFGSRLYITSHY